MARKTLIFALIVVAIVLAVVFLCKPAPSPGPAPLTISNFTFSEYTIPPGSEIAVPVSLEVTDYHGEVVFEGPIMKPDPCHTLTASYRVESVDKVIVNITANPGPPGTACIQVIVDTFYRGSFNYTGGVLEELTINYQGQELGKLDRSHMYTVFTQ